MSASWTTQPMFEATLDPDAHPELAAFLADVSGIDSVDDESLADLPMQNSTCSPAEWTQPENPPCVAAAAAAAAAVPLHL